MLKGNDVSTEDLIRLRAFTHGLQLPASHSVLRSGSSRSYILGRGMEYEKSRRYESGDDARMIDWRVTARTGVAHTKVFQEDRQRAVHIVVDLTESMRFGTQVAFKSVVAAEAAAIIAWAAFSHGDIVNVIGVNDDGVSDTSPTTDSRSLIRQLQMLSNLSRSKSVRAPEFNHLAQALTTLTPKVHTGDMVIVLSDFANLASPDRKTLEYFARRRALLVFWIQDLVEREALPTGSFPITDGERFTTLQIARSKRKLLQRVLDNRNLEIEKFFKDSAVPMIRLNSDSDVLKSIYQAFHRSIRAAKSHTRRV